MNIKTNPPGSFLQSRHFISRPEECPAGTLQSLQARSRFVELKRDETLRLGKTSGVSGILVEEGVVWLTETSGDGDIILQAGERFEFSNRWPVVIQSLGASQAALLA